MVDIKEVLFLKPMPMDTVYPKVYVWNLTSKLININVSELLRIKVLIEHRRQRPVD